MKTPKPTQLKSGVWRIQLQINGERHSLVANSRDEVEQKAKELFAGIQEEKRIPETLGNAIDKYIVEREGIYSPSTLANYRMIRRNHLKGLMDKRISDITQNDIQLAIKKESVLGRSPKTIRNTFYLLTAVLKNYRPAFVKDLDVSLPKKKKPKYKIPNEKEMQKIWKVSEGSKYELAILLASWFGLRMSEVRGLKFSDIKGNKIHIQRARIRIAGEDVDKRPKTEAGDRWLDMPENIAKLIAQKCVKGHENDYICPYSHNSIRQAFSDICEKAGVPHCRYHDLRHFVASEYLALGVPNKYSMQMMGHATEDMLKDVYQHVMEEKQIEFAKVFESHLANLYNNS